MVTTQQFKIVGLCPETQSNHHRYFVAEALASISSYNDLNAWADSPDHHLIAIDAQAEVIGRVSLWWSNVPAHKGLRTAFVGHYDALCDAVGQALLEEAGRIAASREIDMLVGPLDGTTWKRYRLVTKRSEYTRFFLEPDNPDSYVDHFRNAGFLPTAIYRSSIANAEQPRDRSLVDTMERLRDQNVLYRPLEAENIDQELTRIYELCIESFKGNLFYSEISLDEFVGMYKRILPLVDLRLTQIAEKDSELVGFLFCYPDKCMLDTGGERAIVTKTLARRPDRDREQSMRGLGKVLMHNVTEAAVQLGYKRVIHALYLGGNESEKISASYNSSIIREYSLFEKVL